MTPKLLAGIMAVTVLYAGAASAQESAAPPAPDSAAVPQEGAATPEAQPAPKRGAVVPEPPEGKGQVVFFRPGKLIGAAVSYKVREDGTELGLLSNGHYFITIADPGPHAYVVHSEVKDVLNLEVEPGETYYVLGSVGIGVVAGRPNISPVDRATFDAVAAKLKPPKK